MLPSGHYSQYITNGISKQKDIDLLVYTDKNLKNLEIKNCGIIKTVWSKTPKYILEIIREIKKDEPDIIHFQHELNMYGGILTASIFPVLFLVLKLMDYRIVTTVHAAVFKKQVDKKFIKLFHQDSPLVKPFVLKVFFYYIYKAASYFSDSIIVHTNLTKQILVNDYGVNAEKINVIPIAIPQKEINNKFKEKYFFYFGYMVRRKGLGYALEGFRKFIKQNPNTEYRLVLAGGVIKGQEKALEEIKKNISDNFLEEKVILKGFIEEKEQDILYKNAYAVVIPAEVSMGSSGPLFHSNSYGKCAICSKIGHFVEDIDDQKTGILVDNDKWEDVFQFAAKNPEKIAEIEKNVENKIISRSPFLTAKKYIELYQKIIY